MSGIAITAQQHGMICLDEAGEVVRPAILWNDPRPARAAADLVAEWGAGKSGQREWIRAVGVVPQPFHTVARLRWLAEHEPTNAARTAAVCLPHDWLTSRLLGPRRIDGLVTDRSDASGTGYWSVLTGEYRLDVLRWALGHDAVVPGVLKPSEPAGLTRSGAVVGPGAGDNAAAALGVGAGPGDVIISIGTSGVVSAVADFPIADSTGEVINFADATGRFLRLATTPIAARVLDATAQLLGVEHGEFSRLALSVPAGSDGLVLLPYFEEASGLAQLRARGVVHGLAEANATPAHIARAAVEGLLCSLAESLDALMLSGARPERLLLVGGAARLRPYVRSRQRCSASPWSFSVAKSWGHSVRHDKRPGRWRQSSSRHNGEPQHRCVTPKPFHPYEHASPMRGAAFKDGTRLTTARDQT